MATKKKVILVIVEGLSDKTALEGVMTKAFEPLNSSVTVECVREDITSDKDVHPGNIVKRVTSVVQTYAKKYGLKAEHFLRVIQITDTDGAYIPDSVVQCPGDSATVNPDPFYMPTAILTAGPPGIRERNANKSANMNKLVSQNTVWRKIPYELYYISCNMEDAFHQRNNLPDEVKADLAAQFHRRYANNIPGFYDFLQSLLPPTPYQDYKSSWEYARLALHSLERGSNLYLALPNDISATLF